MIKIDINENNPSSVATKLAEKDAYFEITADVKFTNQGEITVGANSVLSFKGGSFRSVGNTTIKLNSCPVEAGAYPIFRDNIAVKGFANAEVKAEWFKWSDTESDDVYINRAIIAARGCPVVLECRTYTLTDSIRFSTDGGRQTLICPGTLSISNTVGNIPAIDVNVQHVTLKINKITGNAITDGYKGIGIKFSVYTDHSDIEVNTMSNLNKGFFVQPNVKGTHTGKPEKDVGGMQYCRFRFGSISADYCFYVDVFTYAQLFSGGNCIDLSDYNDKQLSELIIEPKNWFNENRISGNLMQGKYGIYIVCPTEAWGEKGRKIQPENVSNALNGLKFENISFEKITVLPIRLRSMIRSCFVNMQMFNSLPGNNSSGTNLYAPWIDLANINEVRMSFNSLVIPTHIKLGDRCNNSYIYGAILDDPVNYVSHFDTLGIDTLYAPGPSGTLVKTSQMYVTNSVVPYNMAKNVTTDGGGQVITKNINELLPNLRDGATNNDQISLQVLPSTVNVEIKKGKTFILDLTGMDSIVPCPHTVNVIIESGGKLIFRASNYLSIQGGTYFPNPDGGGGTTIKEFTSGGLYQIQWLSNWVISINKVANP